MPTINELVNTKKTLDEACEGIATTINSDDIVDSEGRRIMVCAHSHYITPCFSIYIMGDSGSEYSETTYCKWSIDPRVPLLIVEGIQERIINLMDEEI